MQVFVGIYLTSFVCFISKDARLAQFFLNFSKKTIFDLTSKLKNISDQMHLKTQKDFYKSRLHFSLTYEHNHARHGNTSIEQVTQHIKSRDAVDFKTSWLIQSSRQDFFIRFLPFRWINVISRTTKSTLMNLAQCGTISRKCFLISSLLRDLIPSWRLLSCFAFRVYRALFKAHKKKQHKKRNDCISITFS